MPATKTVWKMLEQAMEVLIVTIAVNDSRPVSIITCVIISDSKMEQHTPKCSPCFLFARSIQC